MNVKDKENDIKKLLLHPEQRASKGKVPKLVDTFQKGLYVISRDVDDLTTKIGMAWGAGGIFQRVKSYKICFPYPTELFIQYAIICPTAESAKELEKIVLKNRRLSTVEANPTAQGRRSEEYKVVASRKDLYDVITESLDAHGDLWTHVVVFGLDSWKVVNQTRASAQYNKNETFPWPLLMRPSSFRTAKPPLEEVPVKPRKRITDIGYQKKSPIVYTMPVAPVAPRFYS